MNLSLFSTLWAMSSWMYPRILPSRNTVKHWDIGAMAGASHGVVPMENKRLARCLLLRWDVTAYNRWEYRITRKSLYSDETTLGLQLWKRNFMYLSLVRYCYLKSNLKNASRITLKFKFSGIVQCCWIFKSLKISCISIGMVINTN